MFYLTNFKNKFLQTQKYILCRIYMYGEGLVHFPKYALLSRTWRQMDSNAQASNHSSVPALGHQASNDTQNHSVWRNISAKRTPCADPPRPGTRNLGCLCRCTGWPRANTWPPLSWNHLQMTDGPGRGVDAVGILVPLARGGICRTNGNLLGS